MAASFALYPLFVVSSCLGSILAIKNYTDGGLLFLMLFANAFLCLNLFKLMVLVSKTEWSFLFSIVTIAYSVFQLRAIRTGTS